MTSRPGEQSAVSRFAGQFLQAAWPDGKDIPPVWAQVVGLAEEAGEFAGAYRRYTGWARRPGGRADMESELADVVISAHVAAHRLDIDLDRAIADKAEIIMSRGFRDPR